MAQKFISDPNFFNASLQEQVKYSPEFIAQAKMNADLEVVHSVRVSNESIGKVS